MLTEEVASDNVTSVALVGPVSLQALSDLFSTSTQEMPHEGAPQVALLCRSLLDAGINVYIVTLTDSLQEPRIFAGRGVRAIAIPYRVRNRARDLFARERRAIGSALQSQRVDAVHAHWTYEYALGALSFDGAPTLVTIRDWAPAIFRNQRTAYRLVRLVMQSWTLARAKHLTVTSPYLKEKVRRFPGRNPVLIPNGVPDKIFITGEREHPSDELKLITVNHGWGARKNVPALLRAFQKVKAELPGSRLALVGTQHEVGGPAYEWATQHRLAKGVRFLGSMPHHDVLQEIGGAGILVHPALEEGFGNVLIEAMAQGTPVIGGKDSGAVPWVLNGGRAGLLVDVTDERNIAESIMMLARDEGLWKRFSESGRSHSWMSFRMSHVAERYIEEYERILKVG